MLQRGAAGDRIRSRGERRGRVGRPGRREALRLAGVEPRRQVYRVAFALAAALLIARQTMEMGIVFAIVLQVRSLDALMCRVYGPPDGRTVGPLLPVRRRGATGAAPSPVTD